MTIYTTGFTKRSAESFFETLRLNGVELLADVRLNNRSQLAGFTRGGDIQYFLKRLCSIDYVHCEELAPTPELLKGYQKKEVSWEEYERRYREIMERRGACRRFAGRLVRLVSDRAGSPMPYYVGHFFDLLNEVEVKGFTPCPDGLQTENVVLDPANIRYQRTFPGSIDDVLASLRPYSPHEPRFMDAGGYKLSSVAGYRHSVEIVDASSVFIGQEDGAGRTTVRFLSGGVLHRHYRITDPKYDLRKLGRDHVEIPHAKLVVSIPAEPYTVDGTAVGYFKFVAAVHTCP